MQDSNIFSVGGSISANCHGWDFRTGTIANTIEELTIINSKGELMILSPSHPFFLLCCRRLWVFWNHHRSKNFVN